MMIITGAAGFLGSCMIGKLNRQNFNYLVAADDYTNEAALANLSGKKIQECVHTAELLPWLAQNYSEIEYIFHFENFLYGTDNKQDKAQSLNFQMMQDLWQSCTDFQIPFIFCLPQSMGQENLNTLQAWISRQSGQPFFWAGLLLPALYGPNEYYLQEKASLVYRAYQALQRQQALPEMQETPAGYLYVKDAVDIMYYLVHHRQHAGLYAIEPEKMHRPEEIITLLTRQLTHNSPAVASDEEQPAMPPAALQRMAYPHALTPLARGIREYVSHYLENEQYY